MFQILCTLLLMCIVGINLTFTTGSIIKSPREIFLPGNETTKVPRPTSNEAKDDDSECGQNIDNTTFGIQLSNTSTIFSGTRNRTEDAELGKKTLCNDTGTILGKPELQVQPPGTIIGNVTDKKPLVQLIQHLELVPVPSEIPILPKPEIPVTTGPSQLFQILQNISIATQLPLLFGNFSLAGLLKPPKPLFELIGAGGGKPTTPKPLYIKIVNLINKMQRKLLQVTGIGKALPNSTTIQAYSDKVLTVIKVLMMDTPF